MKKREYSTRIQFYANDVSPLLCKFLKERHWQSCLDLGCGDGALLSSLSKRGYFQDKTVYAHDLSEDRIKVVKAMNEDVNCLVGDATDTGIQHCSIDFIISTQVIEHVANDQDMIKEMHRILAKEGVVYLTTVFKAWYGWYFYRCNGKWTLDPTHVREYTHDGQLLDLLCQCGFEILVSKKSLEGRPLLDFIFRRISAPRTVYSNRFLRRLRTLRVPIFGYYNWEIVCQKK